MPRTTNAHDQNEDDTEDNDTTLFKRVIGRADVVERVQRSHVVPFYVHRSLCFLDFRVRRIGLQDFGVSNEMDQELQHFLIFQGLKEKHWK